MKTVCLEDDLVSGEMPGLIMRGSLNDAIERVKRRGYAPRSLEILNVYVTINHEPFVTPAIYFVHPEGKRAILFPDKRDKSVYALKTCPSID